MASGHGNGPAARILQVKVKPNARLDRLEQAEDGTWLASLKAQPVDGKANDALLRFVADRLHLPKSAVLLKSGQTSRHKILEVSGASAEAVAALLAG